MFHCNGWCFTWGVTAFGATHVCLRRVESSRVWDLIDAEGITHYCGAPTVQIGIVNDPKAHALVAPGDRRGRRRAALADPARQACAPSDSAPSTSTGSPETYGPHTRVRVAPGVGPPA